jgi:hypothetical protein
MYNLDLWEYRGRRRVLLRAYRKAIRRKELVSCREIQLKLVNLRAMTSILRSVIGSNPQMQRLLKPE